MRALVYILFGTSLTLATSWALGTILLRKLSLTLYRLEERLFAFVVGSACLSAIVFLLATVKLARKGVFLGLGILIIGYAFYSGAHRPRGKEFPALPRLWKWVFTGAFGAFTVLYFFNALAPEASPDGMAYHLGEVARYYRAHGFVRITTNIYANLSQGIELLFLHAFAFGKHSAASLVHYSFLVALAFLMLAYARRLGRPAVGVAGAVFVYASPVVGQDATSAYIDVAVASLAFALFYLLQVWDQERDARLLVPIGILTGFCFAAKYTTFLAVPYALGFIAWKSWRARRPVFRPVLATGFLALLFIAPWLVKNWTWVDNPVSPFANRLFPNPYVHISFEETYRRAEASYGLTSYWQIPWQLTVKGDVLAGFLGPIFLLAPVALLALRHRAGRQLWLAALVFGLPYYANVGTRFLIPAAPFIALAIAWTFAGAGWLLLALTLLHAASGWPSVAKLYCSPYAWRTLNIPFRAALRIESEDAYLSRKSLAYCEARLIERAVPKGEKVFCFTQTGDAYTSHETLVRYQAAFNEFLGDILWTPMFRDFQPTRILTFRFASRELRAIRAVQTARAKEQQWSVAELRVYQNGNELPRAPAWRLRAHPNPWDVQLAFDNSPATRWRSWQNAEPGMFLEVDFGGPQDADSVVLESSPDSAETKVKLEGRDARGQWSTIAPEPVVSSRPSGVNLRLAAPAELKARGIRYVMVEKTDIRSEDFEFHSDLWGMKCVGQFGNLVRLYHIE